MFCQSICRFAQIKGIAGWLLPVIRRRRAGRAGRGWPAGPGRAAASRGRLWRSWWTPAAAPGPHMSATVQCNNDCCHTNIIAYKCVQNKTPRLQDSINKIVKQIPGGFGSLLPGLRGAGREMVREVRCGEPRPGVKCFHYLLPLSIPPTIIMRVQQFNSTITI